MESIYPELALCGRKNECARTDTVFSPYLRSAKVRFPLNFRFLPGPLVDSFPIPPGPCQLSQY